MVRDEQTKHNALLLFYAVAGFFNFDQARLRGFRLRCSTTHAVEVQALQGLSPLDGLHSLAR